MVFPIGAIPAISTLYLPIRYQHIWSNIMSRRFIKIKELNKITSLSTATTYRLIAEGKFPKQIKVTGSKSVAWDSLEIADWIEQRIADSKKAA